MWIYYGRQAPRKLSENGGGGETITIANPTETSNVKALKTRQKQGVMRAEHETCHPHNKSGPPLSPRGDSVKTNGLTERQPERQTRKQTKPTTNQPNKNTQRQTNRQTDKETETEATARTEGKQENQNSEKTTRKDKPREHARMRNTVAPNVWEASKVRPWPEWEPDKFIEETRKEHGRNVLQRLNTP